MNALTSLTASQSSVHDHSRTFTVAATPTRLTFFGGKELLAFAARSHNALWQRYLEFSPVNSRDAANRRTSLASPGSWADSTQLESGSTHDAPSRFVVRPATNAYQRLRDNVPAIPPAGASNPSEIFVMNRSVICEPSHRSRASYDLMTGIALPRGFDVLGWLLHPSRLRPVAVSLGRLAAETTSTFSIATPICTRLPFPGLARKTAISGQCTFGFLYFPNLECRRRVHWQPAPSLRIP